MPVAVPVQVCTVFYRFVLLGAGGLCAAFASQAASINSAGPIACLTLAFVSAVRWRRHLNRRGQVVLRAEQTGDAIATMHSILSQRNIDTVALDIKQ